MGIPALVDVAAAAGVSPGLLSDYMSFRRRNPGTRRRILDAVNSLRRPNSSPLTHGDLWNQPTAA